MLDRSKFLPVVDEFFGTHAHLFADWPQAWPEDAWYTVFDADGTEYDINLWSTESEGEDPEPDCRAAIYPVVNGSPLTTVYVTLDVQYHWLKAKLKSTQNVMFTQAQEIIAQHDLLRMAHECLVRMSNAYDDADAQEMLAIIENEVSI